VFSRKRTGNTQRSVKVATATTRTLTAGCDTMQPTAAALESRAVLELPGAQSRLDLCRHGLVYDAPDSPEARREITTDDDFLYRLNVHSQVLVHSQVVVHNQFLVDPLPEGHATCMELAWRPRGDRPIVNLRSHTVGSGAWYGC
jgi:hypothetical protein